MYFILAKRPGTNTILKEPIAFPLYLAPCACAQSSITFQIMLFSRLHYRVHITRPDSKVYRYSQALALQSARWFLRLYFHYFDRHLPNGMAPAFTMLDARSNAILGVTITSSWASPPFLTPMQDPSTLSQSTQSHLRRH